MSMWVTAVPPFGPDDVGVLIGVEPSSQAVGALLDRGHEGEEGVFYLLPDDLLASYERNGPRLTVRLLAWPPDEPPTEPPTQPATEPPTEPAGERVTLLVREIETSWEPAVTDGEPQAVLLVLHDGTATLDELLADDETAYFVVGAVTVTQAPS